MSSLAPPVSLSPNAAIEPSRAPAKIERERAASVRERVADAATSLKAEGVQRSLPRQGKVEVQLDKLAGRFVHILTDADTEETLRKYPSESQLAYARAVNAYLRAQANG